MGWVANATPRPFYPRKRAGTSCIGGGESPRAGLDGCENVAPPRIDPRTVQPVASRYTDCVMPADINKELTDHTWLSSAESKTMNCGLRRDSYDVIVDGTVLST